MITPKHSYIFLNTLLSLVTQLSSCLIPSHVQREEKVEIEETLLEK